jgi:endoribonuclease Dicer
MEQPAATAAAAPPAKERRGEEQARKYQLEVLEQAKVKNTIAFLETGAGKTLIAVLLMKHKYETMRQQNQRMLAVFLVPKVPLVYQVKKILSFLFQRRRSSSL